MTMQNNSITHENNLYPTLLGRDKEFFFKLHICKSNSLWDFFSISYEKKPPH